jgi:hypothetical protein
MVRYPSPLNRHHPNNSGAAVRTTGVLLILALLGVFLMVCPASGAEKGEGNTGPSSAYGPAPILVLSDVMTSPAEENQTKESLPDEHQDKAVKQDTADGKTGAPEKADEKKDNPEDQAASGKTGAPEKSTSHTDDAPDGSGAAKDADIIWLPDDCGCTPIQPRKVQGKGIITYGFFHRGLALEEDKATGAMAAKIKFSRINRIGYHSLVYDMEKGFLNYEDWEDNTYVKTARQYNSRVDIVLTFSDTAAKLFANKDKTRVLAADIERLIQNYGGSGVTVDIRGTSGLDLGVLEGFLEVLREKLTDIDDELFLNLMTGFDPEAKEGPLIPLPSRRWRG